MTDRHDQLARLAQAAMNGILDASRAEKNGVSYFDPALAQQALVACLPSIIETDDSTKTRRDMRMASEQVAKAVRLQVEALQAHFEGTGEHSGWDASAVSLQ